MTEDMNTVRLADLGFDGESEEVWWAIADRMYERAMEGGDFKLPGEGAHRLEVSPFVLHCLQQDQEGWVRRVGTRPGDTAYGFFGIVAVDKGLPLTRFRDADWDMPYDFRHMAVRVERENGRFRYIDWDGNPKELR